MGSREATISQAVFNRQLGKKDWFSELEKKVTAENYPMFLKECERMNAESVRDYIINKFEDDWGKEVKGDN